MIKIVDYGLGNVKAFLNLYGRLNIPAGPAKRVEDLADASKLILPGVGAFDHAMDLLNQSGMRETLEDMVLQNSVPILGVCVGMQILAASSDEGKSAGLGWVRGRVRGFRSLNLDTPPILPHMGWNDVRPAKTTKIFDRLNAWQFYFLHSYYFDCEDEQDAAAVCDYGINFVCAVQSRNIYGVQFHPEKSHQFGLQLLQNFAEL